MAAALSDCNSLIADAHTGNTDRLVHAQTIPFAHHIADSRNRQTESVLEDLSVSTNLKDRFAALDSLLHSRYVLQRVIEDAKLLPKDAPQSEYDSKINQLSAAVTLSLVGSDLVQLTFKTQQPQDSAVILQAISERFLENVLAPEQSSISGSEKFLKEQITKQEIELNKAEKNLADFKRSQSAELPDLYSANVNRLHALKDKEEENALNWPVPKRHWRRYKRASHKLIR